MLDNGSDITAMLDELGVSVTLGTNETKGLVDYADELVLETDVTASVGRMIAVTIKTGSLPGLAIGSALTVDGSPYKAREVLRIGDGALTRVMLSGG
jgi:hypothetical protein